MLGIRTPTKSTKGTEEDPQGKVMTRQTNQEMRPKPKEDTAKMENWPKPKKDEESPGAGVCTAKTSGVRRSIGEWESGKPDSLPSTSTSPRRAVPVGSQKTNMNVTFTPEGPKTKYTDRLTEARACLNKAKLNLGTARNLKTDIKTAVIQGLDRLYQLVKEGENVKRSETGKLNQVEVVEETKDPEKRGSTESELVKKMMEHSKLIQENNERMEKLKEAIEKQQEAQEKLTYASVAAASRRQSPEQTALHSVVITAKDETESGDEILKRIREAVNAKDGGVAVERIRKAKDRKVIVGCRTVKEREQIKERLKRAENHLNVQEVKNKNPLVILRDVLNFNTDEDILKGLWNQNHKILRDIEGDEKKVEILYRKRARNPQMSHVVMRVTPKIWKQLVEAETVVIDLQRVRVADQSPLVQCSLCLGYGHGRRFCKDTIEKCSHCGGPHMKAECTDLLAGMAPVCCNCTHAKLDKREHNAFSEECPIRRKWEALARATIAYC